LRQAVTLVQRFRLWARRRFDLEPVSSAVTTAFPRVDTRC